LYFFSVAGAHSAVVKFPSLRRNSALVKAVEFEKYRRVAARLWRPRRLINWLRARAERDARPDRLRSLPLGIDLEPTTRCNLRCRICQRSEPGWPELEMPVERFDRLLDQFPALEQLKLQGIGEPFLHDRLFDLIRRAKRRRIRVFTITNGTTLDRSEHRQAVLESRLDELRVSIDGATPESHARRRPGADLDRIVDGLRRLVQARGRSRRPLLGIWCVGDAQNVAELPALVALAATIGVDELTFQTDLTSWGKSEWRARLEAMRLEARLDSAQLDSAMLDSVQLDPARLDSAQRDSESAEIARRFAEAKTDAAPRGLRFVAYAGNRFNESRPCFWPWESCFVSAGGLVTRCCILSDPRLHAFGSIEELSPRGFHALWNSPEYRDLRRNLREGRIPPLCRECYAQR
jgi:pyrroloquinoline quinone biosynthesis protein E